jgi:hypothetical protein
MQNKEVKIDIRLYDSSPNPPIDSDDSRIYRAIQKEIKHIQKIIIE